MSSNHTSAIGRPDSIRPTDRNSPSENRMMFALWPSVTLRRPLARANSSANRTIRLAPVTEIGFTRDAGVVPNLVTGRARRSSSRERRRLRRAAFELDPLVQVLGVLADHDEVDVGVAGRDPRERRATGRTAANRSSS